MRFERRVVLSPQMYSGELRSIDTFYGCAYCRSTHITVTSQNTILNTFEPELYCFFGVMPPSQLKIATGSLSRLVKEEASYHKEYEAQKARLAKLEQDQDDQDGNREFKIKQEVSHLHSLSQNHRYSRRHHPTIHYTHVIHQLMRISSN